mgnify:CR=1 FL=1
MSQSHEEPADRRISFGESVYDADGNHIGSVRGLDEHGFYVSTAEGVVIDSQLAQVFSRIEEVRNDKGSVLVRLSDGSELVSTMVEGLRSTKG